MSSAPALHTRGLTLDIGGQQRVRGLDIDLPNAGISVIMGPNGAGKSLLLRLLHGLIAPTAGTILWDEIPMSVERRHSQGMVFQRPVMLRRTVAGNLDFVLKGDPKRRDSLLRDIGLLDQAHQSARALSGGEQQRLALARALARGPDTLFLDEATASLDPAATLQIEAIVTEAAQRGTKILLVTHDIGQAKRLATDVLFMHKGAVTEHTSAAEFFKNPISDAATAYLDGQIIL